MAKSYARSVDMSCLEERREGAAPPCFPSGSISGVVEREWTSGLAKSHVACTPIYAQFCRSARPLLRCSSLSKNAVLGLLEKRIKFQGDIFHCIDWLGTASKMKWYQFACLSILWQLAVRDFFFSRGGGAGSLHYDHSWLTSLNIVCLFHNSDVSFSTYFFYRGSITFLRPA